MTSDWKEYKLSELSEIKGGKRLPAKTSLIQTKTAHPYIRVRDLTNKKILDVTSEFEYVDDETQKSISKYIVNEGDVIISIVGTIGLVAIIGATLEKANLTENCAKFINLKKIDNHFLYYYLISEFGQQEIKKNSVGAVQAKLPLYGIGDIKINLPPLDTQQKIVKVLSAIDDKIELNNKINENLEQQAQAIFKSWFVDFEPFGGVMPEDWEIAKLTDIAEYLNGLAMQKFRPKENEKSLPILKIKELRQCCCDATSDLCSENINSNYIINDGDVIFSWSGTLLLDFWCGGKCGLNQHLFKVTSKKYDKWFYYYWTKYHLDKFIAIATDKATTMGHIKREDLEKSEILIPTQEIYKEVDNIVKPLIEKIILNRIENRSLIQLRDTLLPKLMSGEIDVSKIVISFNKTSV